MDRHQPNDSPKDGDMGKYQTGHGVALVTWGCGPASGISSGTPNMAQVSRPKAITRSAYLAGFYSGHVRRAATKSVSYRKVSRDKMERVIRLAERKRRTRSKKEGSGMAGSLVS